MTAALTTDTILLITGVGTLVTAAAALATVLEMRRQRRALYIPEFVCKAPPLKIRRNEEERAISFDVLVLAADERRPSRVPAALECSNIGLGPAKRITYKWTFDAASLVEALANAGVDVSDIVIERDLLRIGGARPAADGDMLNELSAGRLPFTVHNLPTQKSGSADVVRPGSSLSILIPAAYVDLFALSLVALAGERREHRRPVAIEPLGLEISYQDVESKSYSRRFTVTPHTSRMSFRPGDGHVSELHEAAAYLEILDA
jgi:hypothetical protein